MASQAAQSKFCRPEEDPFLLLDRASRSIEQLLRRDLPLRRTWSEQPYGEEEITRLEEEVLPAIAQCLARVPQSDCRRTAWPVLLDVIGSFSRPQRPDGVTAMPFLVIRCHKRDVTLSLKLAGHLTEQGSLVVLNRQAHVGPWA